MTSHFKLPKLIAVTLLAILMFSPMFVLHGLGKFDFWWWMSTNLVVLISLSLFIDPTYRKFLREDFSTGIPRKLLFGLASAVLLYFFFFAGNKLSRLMFDFAGQGISDVYAFKGDAEGIRIGILMLLVIGPGEEFFWRGFLQRHFQDRLGQMERFHTGDCHLYRRPRPDRQPDAHRGGAGGRAFLGLDVHEVQFHGDEYRQPYDLGYFRVSDPAFQLKYLI